MTAPTVRQVTGVAARAVAGGSIVWLCTHQVGLAVAVGVVIAVAEIAELVFLLIVADPYRSVRCLIQAESEMALLRALYPELTEERPQQ